MKLLRVALLLLVVVPLVDAIDVEKELESVTGELEKVLSQLQRVNEENVQIKNIIINLQKNMNDVQVGKA